MKLIILISISFLGLMAIFPATTFAGTMAESTSGRVLLQVEQHGELWYVNPTDQLRYNVSPTTPADLFQAVGLGISNVNLKLIPKQNETWSGDAAVLEHVRGKIVLQVERGGAAWYINPANGKRYGLGNVQHTWKVFTKLALGISNANLDRLVPGDTTPNSLPDSVRLNVPFTTQAPTGNWSSPFGEACEEAIIVMLSHYYSNTGFSASQVQDEILAIVNWEMEQYGHHEDTSAVETANTAQQYSNLAVAVSTDVSIQRMKELLAQGHPLITPVDGKLLTNPHYRNGGPYYHMILVIGYEGNEFITHDPGTRYGDNYRFNMDEYLNAIHDLTNPESDAANGAKTILIVDSK